MTAPSPPPARAEAPAARRLLAGTGTARSRLLFGATAALALLAALAGGELGGSAARALAAVALLGLAAFALRGRRPPSAAGAALRVTERHPLGRDTGVAWIEADGRRLLVGYGPAGIALLAAADPVVARSDLRREVAP